MRGNAQRGRAALAALLVSISLAGCGVIDRVTSTPTITELPSHPDEIAATAPAITPTSASTSTTPAGPAPAGVQPTERLVIVGSLGVGLAAPLLFTEIDPDEYPAGSAALDQLSRQMGLNPAQVRTALLDQVARMVVGRGDDGGPASIVVVRTPLETLPSASLLRKDIGRLLGGAVSKVSHPVTPAGTAVRAVYRLGSAGDFHYGEALYLETDDAVVSVTMTARTPAEAKRLATRVVRTIRLTE